MSFHSQVLCNTTLKSLTVDMNLRAHLPALSKAADSEAQIVRNIKPT